MKRFLAFSFILVMSVMSAFTALAAGSYTDFGSASGGPGVISFQQGSTSPRIDLPSAVKNDISEETAATGETKAEAGTAADGTEAGDGKTTLLENGESWEEKVAKDLLLTEQKIPESGELYHSRHFYSSSATVTINNEGTDDTYIKFYSEDDELVFSAYIRQGEKIKIQIPGGVYRMKQAFGEKWYGLTDMFGNCGRYCECSIGTQKTFNIKRSGSYVISTQGQGDAFDKKEVTKAAF